MNVSSSAHRHSVEKYSSLVRVILPSKKSVFNVIGFCVWFPFWGFMVYNFLYFWMSFFKISELNESSAYEAQTVNIIILASLCILPLLTGTLMLGIAGIFRFFWLISGKEIIEINSEELQITRQTFIWKKTRKYALGEVKNLRLLANQSSFSLIKSFQKLLSRNGKIAFTFGSKTIRFGVDTDESEAKQIILVIQEGLAQQQTG